jgi:hypothetical protein
METAVRCETQTGIPQDGNYDRSGAMGRVGPEQRESPHLWVARGPTWVTTTLVKRNSGRNVFIQVTNIGDKPYNWTFT